MLTLDTLLEASTELGTGEPRVNTPVTVPDPVELPIQWARTESGSSVSQRPTGPGTWWVHCLFNHVSLTLRNAPTFMTDVLGRFEEVNWAKGSVFVFISNHLLQSSSYQKTLCCSVQTQQQHWARSPKTQVQVPALSCLPLSSYWKTLVTQFSHLQNGANNIWLA